MGDPIDDSHFWQIQTTPFTCAVQAQRGIIESFTGEPISEAQLVYDATSHGWLTDGGMSMNDVGKILELYGVPCHQRAGGKVEDLMDELSQGHKVIVGVDSGEIWNRGQPLDDFFHHAADHAVWVTGINNDDPNNPKVIINDSGDPNGAGKEYELSRFVDAWEDSGFFYVATDEAPSNLERLASGFDADKGVFPDLVSYFDAHTQESHGTASLAASSADEHVRAQEVIDRMPSGQQIADDVIKHVKDIVYHTDPSVIKEGNRIAQNVLDHIDSVHSGEMPLTPEQAREAERTLSDMGFDLNEFRRIDEVTGKIPGLLGRDGLADATGADATGGRTVQEPHQLLDEARGDHEVRFGAGKCFHCGGLGYSTWPSSGSKEKCFYCDGSGVAH